MTVVTVAAVLSLLPLAALRGALRRPVNYDECILEMNGAEHLLRRRPSACATAAKGNSDSTAATVTTVMTYLFIGYLSQ